MLTMRRLSPGDGRDVYDMLQELPAEENGFINEAHGLSWADFPAYLAARDAWGRQKGLADGWRVPETTYWAYAQGRPVGMVKVRHFLTPALARKGGHIGYAVRPSCRGRGYGRALLAQALALCQALGIRQALATIQAGNAPSLAIARSLGGVDRGGAEGCRLITFDLTPAAPKEEEP